MRALKWLLSIDDGWQREWRCCLRALDTFRAPDSE